MPITRSGEVAAWHSPQSSRSPARSPGRTPAMVQEVWTSRLGRWSTSSARPCLRCCSLLRWSTTSRNGWRRAGS